MFLANMGRGRSKNRQGPLGPGEGRIQEPYLSPPSERVLKGEGTVHGGGLWGPSYFLPAGAGGASVSERPRKPVLCFWACFLSPGPPL